MKNDIDKVKKLIVGKKVRDANKILKGFGFIMRAPVRDGVEFTITADFRPNRVNVSTENGIVVDILRFG
jgi:hypothetical protein